MTQFCNTNIACPTSALYANCNQCPRKCGVDRTHKIGFCGETNKVRVSSASLHFGEEPVITVFGGSGTIFFTGCTLKCAFCQNYQISQKGIGRVITKKDFITICTELQKNGAENINLVTGSHHIPLIAEYILEAKNKGITIPFCWNSSGYESVQSLKLLQGLVDIWLPDIKTLDETFAKKTFGAENYPECAKNAIIWMIENSPLKIETITAPFNQNVNSKHNENHLKEKLTSGVIVRHLYLPGRFEDTNNVLSWLKQNVDTKAIVSLMNQYTPVPFVQSAQEKKLRDNAMSLMENRLVTKTEDQDLRDLIDAYDFEYLFYQKLSYDTDWLPDFTKQNPFPNKLARTVF